MTSMNEPKPEFRWSEADKDPVTNRLYRDKWALRQTTFRFSYHVNVDPIVSRSEQDTAANATKGEIETLITALDVHYRELGEKLAELKRANPLAQMPGESEIKYRKRVPGCGAFSSEQCLVLVWLAHERTDVGRWIKALRGGHRPGIDVLPINSDQTTMALFEPFGKRYRDIYFAALHVEEERVRAIVEATPIDDAAWEAYQVQCDRNDAYREVEAALIAECKAKGGSLYTIYGNGWHDIVRERTDQRAPEITRARHARERQANAPASFAAQHETTG